ncbi:MAG: hypothetical protein II297_00605 [Clostridia bacterium]|nr:hypothetical protein [Clostridia bacterium]
MKQLNCLRCQKEMRYIKREKLQLGKTDWLFGDLPNLIAGAMDVDVYTCTGCGKIEFFLAETHEENDPPPQPDCRYK